MSWDPTQYLQFAGERLRPALDLLARIPLATPQTVVDLGCGAGNVTRFLAGRWPDARIVGVDNDAAMLEKARTTVGRPAQHVQFAQADLNVWRPDASVDVVYSNAALQWLPNHAALFARVVQMVRPGGVLAVQMPSNFGAPSHVALTAMATGARFGPKLSPLLRTHPVAAPADYFSWLAPWSSAIDIWTSEYLQVLAARTDGAHAVVEWTKGTWLAPMLAALDADERAEFIVDYSARMHIAYPPLPDGRVLFPFKRLFIVAKR
jgi:trans-aconitate 2-methyltransferase